MRPLFNNFFLDLYQTQMERHSKGVHEFAPDAIIIVPTRELAIQIADITRKLYAGSEMRVQAFFHNTAEQQAYKRKRQLAAMLARAKKGVNIMALNMLRICRYAKYKTGREFK